ncbi:MAG: hypothetical protein ACLFM7_02675 [Bacteroidales bacterium]
MLTLLKIFLFFVILVFVGGLISRYLLKRFFRNVQQNIHNQYSTEQKKKKEGKVTIEYDKKRGGRKKFSKDQGDYVDYEEMDE